VLTILAFKALNNKNMLKKIKIFFLILLSSAPLAVTAASLENPLGTTDLRVVAGNIIKGVLALSGTAALLMFIYGGAQWIMSQGEKTKIEKGQKTVIWAALGLCFIFVAYAALYALMSILGSATTTTT